VVRVLDACGTEKKPRRRSLAGLKEVRRARPTRLAELRCGLACREVIALWGVLDRSIPAGSVECEARIARLLHNLVAGNVELLE
jgi:hypothetical protein